MTHLLTPLESLTRRELEILSLVGCGLTQRQVAKRLCLAVKTVETHMDSVRRKLRVHNTMDAARVALDAGLIPVPMAVR